MDEKFFRILERLEANVARIAQSLATVAYIDQQRLKVENIMAINADSVNQILDLLDKALDKDASDVAAKDEAVAKYNDLKTRDSGLDDPALQQKFDAVVAKAAASTPPAPANNPPADNPPAANPPANDPNSPVVPDPNAAG